jgi:hypothetical protein
VSCNVLNTDEAMRICYIMLLVLNLQFAIVFDKRFCGCKNVHFTSSEAVAFELARCVLSNSAFLTRPSPAICDFRFESNDIATLKFQSQLKSCYYSIARLRASSQSIKNTNHSYHFIRQMPYDKRARATRKLQI